MSRQRRVLWIHAVPRIYMDLPDMTRHVEVILLSPTLYRIVWGISLVLQRDYLTVVDHV